MAGETAKSSATATGIAPGSRTTPVLVPQGDFAGKPDLPLDRPVTTVGSRHTSRIHLLSRSVSKAHALFVNSSGTTYVSDLNSRTGVIVNGKAVASAELKTGDRVQIGKFQFRYRAPKPAAPVASVEPSLVQLERDGKLPVSVAGRTLLIGRRESAGLSLRGDKAVSTAHAALFTLNGEWYLRDLGSRTGTRVNDKPIHQQKLSFGDRIDIGSRTIRFAPASDAAIEARSDIAASPSFVEESPESSRVPLGFDSVAAEAVVTPQVVPAADEHDPFAQPVDSLEDIGLDFLDEAKAALAQATPTAAPLKSKPLESVEIDKSETLIPVEESNLPELDLAGEATAEPEPLSGEEPPGRLMVDVDLHTQDRLTGSGTHTDLQHEADEALADAGQDLAESPLAATPADAESNELAGLNAPPLVDEIPLGEGTIGVEPQAVVTPRRGWRTTVLPRPLDPQPLDETPSPVAPPGPSAEIDEAALLAPVSEALSDAPATPAAEAPVFNAPPEELSLDDLEEDFSAAPVDADDADEPPPAPVTESVEESPELDVADLVEVEEIAAANEPKLAAHEGIEILDRTEPTPESALDLGSAVPEQNILASTEAGAVPIDAALTDTTFGRAVDEFTGPSTGPIVEHVEDIAVAEPEASVQELSDLAAKGRKPGGRKPAAPKARKPASRKKSAADDQAVESLSEARNESVSIDDLVIPVLPGTTTEAVARAEEPQAKTPFDFEESAIPAAERTVAKPEVTEARVSEPQADAGALTLSDIGELEEFVAVPEDEPAASRLSLDLVDEANRAASRVEFEPIETGGQAKVTEPPPLGNQEPAAELSVDDLEELGTADLEDLAAVAELPSEEPVPSAPAAAEATPTTPGVDAQASDTVKAVEPPTVAPPAAQAPGARQLSPKAEPSPIAPRKDRPSLFGFNFDGDSFLGGMPLKLGKTPRPQPAPPGKGFEFKPKTGRGADVGSITMPVAPPAQAPPSKMPPAKAPPATPPAQSPAARAPQPVPPTAPRPAVAPQVPPAVRPPGRAPARSITDLSSQPISESTQPTTIPTLADDMTVPPLARPVATPPSKRKPLRTAFDGLAGGRGVRNTDVFSQMAPPISADAFGRRRSSGEDFEIPQTSKAVAPAPFDNPDTEPREPPRASAPGGNGAGNIPRPPGEGVRGASGAPPAARRSRVPMLLTMMILTAAAAVALVYFSVPHYSQITAGLSFSNLAAQPEIVQQAFRIEQVKRLHSEAVRNQAGQVFVAQHQSAGFLESPAEFENALPNDAIKWNGETLAISYLAPDEPAGRAQLASLLTALSQNDRDLGDKLARAQRERDDAKAAVDRAALKADDLKKQMDAKKPLGEDRPDPVELARLDDEAARMTKSRDAAAAARAAGENALAGLRAIDPSQPLNVATDPQLGELRKQLEDVNGQIAALQPPGGGGTDTATTQPAGADNSELLKQLQDEADSLKTKVDERLAVVQADQAVSPEQRAVNREKAVEDQGVRIGMLQAKEREAIQAADAALAKAKESRDRLERARQATAQLMDLQTQAIAVDKEHTSAVLDQDAKEQALSQCIALAGDGTPAIASQPHTDPRPMLAGSAAGLVILIFSFMILTAHRAASGHAAPYSAAVNTPPQPAIPLPHDESNAGSNGNGQAPAIPSPKDRSEESEEPIAV